MFVEITALTSTTNRARVKPANRIHVCTETKRFLNSHDMGKRATAAQQSFYYNRNYFVTFDFNEDFYFYSIFLKIGFEMFVSIQARRSYMSCQYFFWETFGCLTLFVWRLSHNNVFSKDNYYNVPFLSLEIWLHSPGHKGSSISLIHCGFLALFE